MTRIGIAHALVVIGLLFCSAGCEKQVDPDVATTQSGKQALPMLAIWRLPGYTISQNEQDYGLLAAVWGDGTVIRTSQLSEAKLGTRYICGTLEQGEVAKIRQFVESTSFPKLAKKEQSVVVDAASMDVVYRPSLKKMVTIAQSIPLPNDSPIPVISNYLMSLKLTDPQPSDFSGDIPGEWRPYK